ncbi:Aste57867_647 [Aphanomyces stellatus]|uniref:Aste57867_647 protein n=1 Tax=Aphanomyces stellatus TaxID=120398 RepID=A0A485K348_9STRA|nr:hypothetical protein As57867_000646 [Aphanomyces stellatus]VFT77872.1 Aste57867_647 [Aphanomyces stellatus]
MGYGQTWLFRYPAPLSEGMLGAEREYSRQPSYYDVDDSPEEESVATVSRDKDVAAFAMTPISQDRILVTTPWTVCELQYLEDDKQFHLHRLGLTSSKAVHSELDYAITMASIPHDSSLLACDVLKLSAAVSALILLYQEPRGQCCLTLQTFSSTPAPSPPKQHAAPTNKRHRFEQSAVPLKSVTTTAVNSSDAIFYGVLLFRTDSITAYGFVHDMPSDTPLALTAAQLKPDQFASFFPHLVDFPHQVVSYHTTTTPDGTRLLALGCANGIVRLLYGKAALDSFASIDGTKQFELDGPLSAIHLFNVHGSPPSSSLNERPPAPLFDVLVSSSIGYAVVYHNPFDPTCKAHFLPDSDEYDSILCCLSADTDMDGAPELLLGTFSNALIAYKQNHPDDPGAPFSFPRMLILVVAPWSVLSKASWDFFFFGPVYSILCQDMNGDGVDEIIIASTDGIHVLEPDCDQVLEKLHAVLALLQQS